MCSIKIIKSNFEELLWSIGQAKSICFTVSKFYGQFRVEEIGFWFGLERLAIFAPATFDRDRSIA